MVDLIFNEQFTIEFIEAFRASADWSILARLVVELRHTAEIHTDPDLVRTLSEPLSGDFGPVPPPVPEIAYPWVRHLPADDLRAFLHELGKELLAAWRATAESYADPEYLAALREVTR